MGKCDLSIELDEPNRVYVGGDKVAGTVHVRVDADVNCKGLEVQSNWRTHGRGNVTKGTMDSQSLYEGQWSAGQQESYRFELAASDWPPSYHGHYISVDHYIDVRAKIPWAFDPKASHEFVVRPSTGPDDKTTASTEISGCVGYFVAGIFLIAFLGVTIAFLVALTQNAIMAGIIAAVAVPGFSFVAAKYFLPRWLLGNVECKLLTETISPGGTVKAQLAFAPKRQVAINNITAKLTGSETCYSGSGSNRTRHHHQFFEDRHVLLDETRLDPVVRKELEVEFEIPNDVPYSFQLTDNSLTWEIEMRVDIPRWPDWTKTLRLQIIPDGGRTEGASLGTTNVSELDSANPEREDPNEITFAETAEHIWRLRDDPDQVDVLVEAVLGLTFDIDTFIERRLLYSGDEDPHVYENGYAVWARHSEPPLPLVLYIPHELADEFEQAGRDLWRCRGTVVGWDHDHRRLQIKILTQPGAD